MTDFVQGPIYNGEEPTSIRLLLEAQWPELAGCVELGWLEYLAEHGQSKQLNESFTQMKGSQENAAGPSWSEYEAWDLDMLRDRCHNDKLQRAERKKRQLEEGVINRVKAEWYCRCRIMTDFFEEKYVTQYCEHRRCHYCRDFNRVGASF